MAAPDLAATVRQAAHVPAATAAFAPDYTARPDGFGPLVFGMSTADAVAAWPGLYADRPQRIAAQDCDFTRAPGVDLPYFTLMFDDGRFVAYGGSNDDVVAPGGGRRGLQVAQLEALYPGALQSAPDRFARGGRLLSVQGRDPGPSRTVFRIRADGRVDEWRVGLSPQVDYEQGCESDAR